PNRRRRYLRAAARVSADRAATGAADEIRVAYDAAHRRSRARDPRRRRVRRAPRGQRPALRPRAAHQPPSRSLTRRGHVRAARALALLQRVLRGSDGVADDRRRCGLPRSSRTGPGVGAVSSRIDPRAVWAVLGVLGALVAVNVPTLGSDPWPFSTAGVRA